jgi:hypothetical protein
MYLHRVLILVSWNISAWFTEFILNRDFLSVVSLCALSRHFLGQFVTFDAWTPFCSYDVRVKELSRKWNVLSESLRIAVRELNRPTVRETSWPGHNVLFKEIWRCRTFYRRHEIHCRLCVAWYDLCVFQSQFKATEWVYLKTGFTSLVADQSLITVLLFKQGYTSGSGFPSNATLFWIFYSVTATCFGRMTIFRWKKYINIYINK